MQNLYFLLLSCFLTLNLASAQTSSSNKSRTPAQTKSTKTTPLEKTSTKAKTQTKSANSKSSSPSSKTKSEAVKSTPQKPKSERPVSSKASTEKSSQDRAKQEKSIPARSEEAPTKLVAESDEEPSPRSPERGASFKQWSVGATIWQEKIEATRDSSTRKILMQLHGLTFDFIYNKPFKSNSRWIQSYMGQGAFGFLKGAGAYPEIRDQLKDQLWIMATLGPSILYRTTPATDIGLMLPLTYRMINWSLEENTTLKMDRENSFSAGLGLVYNNRLSNSTNLRLQITNQYLWQATMWSFAYIKTF